VTVQINDSQVLILCALADGPKHGYAVNEDVERLIGFRLGPGSLYGALNRLAAKRLVEALPGQGRQQPFRLTAGGRRALEAELRLLERVAATGLERLARPAPGAPSVDAATGAPSADAGTGAPPTDAGAGKPLVDARAGEPAADVRTGEPPRE
jgi:DNA-binding PadR family transcriptional regulator